MLVDIFIQFGIPCDSATKKEFHDPTFLLNNSYVPCLFILWSACPLYQGSG